jgi:hypothetical protein
MDATGAIDYDDSILTNLSTLLRTEPKQSTQETAVVLFAPFLACNAARLNSPRVGFLPFHIYTCLISP